MSYTLRGRLESRLTAVGVTLVAAMVLAAATEKWWPLELLGVMTLVGLAADVVVYHRLFDYQPGWVAVPLGAAELALVLVSASALGIRAPLAPALALYAGGWIAAQVLGHALLPLLRLSYGQDGGELGAAGVAVAACILAVFGSAAGIAWAKRPPTVRLAAGVHEGPLVITRRQILVADGAIVRGGIKVRADDVTIRGVTVIGGEYGIDVEDAQDVVLDRVAVRGATLDGIRVRRSTVAIEDCVIDSTGSVYGQGIDISFTFDLAPSRVERCTVVGGQEGIVTHFARVLLRDNHVARTSLRAIAMTEMSMGEIDRNHIRDAQGVGIFCGDSSMCMVERNDVAGTRPDRSSDDDARGGYAILAHYHAEAELRENVLAGNARAVGALADGRIAHRR